MTKNPFADRDDATPLDFSHSSFCFLLEPSFHPQYVETPLKLPFCASALSICFFGTPLKFLRHHSYLNYAAFKPIYESFIPTQDSPSVYNLFIQVSQLYVAGYLMKKFSSSAKNPERLHFKLLISDAQNK